MENGNSLIRLLRNSFEFLAPRKVISGNLKFFKFQNLYKPALVPLSYQPEFIKSASRVTLSAIFSAIISNKQYMKNNFNCLFDATNEVSMLFF